MTASKHYYYFVEGENEEKLINVLKTTLQLIPAGKVLKFNGLTRHITKTRLLEFERNSVVIFVFDTDDESAGLGILNDNEKQLDNSGSVIEHYCITQVKNIEDELVRSTDVKKIEDLLPSKTKKLFKNDFNRMKATVIARKLKEHHFDINLLWSEQPEGKFSEINNDSDLIKNNFRKRVSR